MPYKYIVSVNSKPFKDAPEAIMSGLNRLTWAGKHAVGAKEYQNANELLALGYFEKQQIHVSYVTKVHNQLILQM